MPQPTLSLTFQDYIIRVAEFLGFASYGSTVAGVPTDTHDLEVCKRIVNDGLRMFHNANPNWNWRHLLFEITFDPDAENSSVVVDEDAARYFMPDGFYGDLQGTLTYADNDGHLELRYVREDAIRQAYAETLVTGTPTLYSLRRLPNDIKRRWELYVWPQPNAALTITGRAPIYPNSLVELTDVPNAGFQFDEAILAACMAQAESQRGQPGIKQQEWGAALGRAVALDRKAAPRRLGNYRDRTSSIRRHAAYTGVDSYTSADGTVTVFD